MTRKPFLPTRSRVDRALFGAGLLLLFAGPAQANPQLLLDAQQLLSAGNPKQAYVLLAAEQSKVSGKEFDYLLGVAALDSGKIDDAIIAFERVLAVDPRNAGALMDLGRAYFVAGSLDLADATFRQLRVSNPPAAAQAAIERYLQAIAQRREGVKRGLDAWGEVSVGYDSNITGVPNDFTQAVVSAFNIPGVDPTGNSIKRKAPYVAAAAGAEYVYPFNANWSGQVGGEVRGRAYRKQADFSSSFGEARAGLTWSSGSQALRFGGSINRFDQDGLAPGEPRQTNDRTTATGSVDYRYALSPQQSVNIGVSASRVRFRDNDIEDFNAIGVGAGWLRNFAGSGSPVLQLSASYSRDEAERKLADGVADKSKRVGGLRSYGQYSLSNALSLFNALGFSVRRDQSAYARATEIQYGRDKLAEVTLGVNWRFQQNCAMRAQWFGSRNDSNIAIYDYNRNEISSNIRCDFQ